MSLELHSRPVTCVGFFPSSLVSEPNKIVLQLEIAYYAASYIIYIINKIYLHDIIRKTNYLSPRKAK